MVTRKLNPPQWKLSPQQLQHLLQASSAIIEKPPGHRLPSFLEIIISHRSIFDGIISQHNYQVGELVITEADLGDAMYVIRAGVLLAFKGSVETPTILGFRTVGDIVGEMALVDDKPRIASLVVIQPARLLRINRADFQQLLATRPDIANSVMSVINNRLRAALERESVYNLKEIELDKRARDLEHQNQELLRLQKFRRDLAGFIYHDLRNPLAVLFGTLDLLGLVLPQDILEANNEVLDTARSASNRMQMLIESLLDITLMESDQTRIRKQQMHVSLVFENLAKQSALLTRMRSISFQTFAPDGLPAIQADEEKISRVLTNLVDNAIKYTPSSGLITVRAEKEGGHIVFSVNDTGPGIPPRERERIFEQFAQVEGEKLSHRGFGLGLAFCKLAIAAHGGKIWVEDGEGGVGSQFKFTLPIES